MIDVNGLLESQQELIDKLTEEVEVLKRIIEIHREIDTQNETIIKNLSGSLELIQGLQKRLDI